jgi:two-component system sensor kinase FixL
MREASKRGEVALKPVLLNQVIEEVLHLIRADLIARGITVVCDLYSALPPVAGDRVQLQQLVLNLMLNAADAMEGNPPEARRLYLQTLLRGGRIRASIRDEGTGFTMPPERLFQPFYTTKPQGLGLGLSICWSIVAAHHGQLWAEPHPERGAVLLFELPVEGTPENP